MTLLFYKVKVKMQFIQILQHFIYMDFQIEFQLDMILQLIMDITDHFKKEIRLIYFIQRENY